MGQNLAGTSRPDGRRRRGQPGGGRPSPGVLVWRWFLVLSLCAVVLIVLVQGVKGVVRLFAPGDGDAVALTASTSPSPVTCTDADVDISLVSDVSTYTVGSMATFTVTLTHIGTAPCTFDGGNVGREVLVTSGSDRIWSSADCDTAGAKLLLMSPGNSESVTVNWATDRSAPGCTTGLPVPRPGTYQAVVNATGVSSKPLVLQLT